jgi:hypothetical protein
VRRTSIADRVARTFPPLACVRGFRYFARRGVTLSNVCESGVDAEVKGKRTQQVRLRVDAGRLAAGCTCAAKLLGPATCKHVWAALLEVDREGALPTLRSTQRVLALGVLDAPAKRTRPPASTASEVPTAKRTTKPTPKSPAERRATRPARPAARPRGKT